MTVDVASYGEGQMEFFAGFPETKTFRVRGGIFLYCIYWRDNQQT